MHGDACVVTSVNETTQTPRSGTTTVAAQLDAHTQLDARMQLDARSRADAGAACDCSDVAAYLDGELGVAEGEAFERHVTACRECASALAEQRRLLCLLDAAFARAQKRVELPEDFARVVKARAQTDMTSVRHTSERRRAALCVVALVAAACALLGGRIAAAGFAPLRAALFAALSVCDMILHTLAETAAGLLFILRGLGRLLATQPRGGGALVILVLACAFVALLRLVSDYHRERLTD